MTKERKREFIEQLRQIIRKSGMTMYELSRKSGVSQAQLSRFMAGKRTLGLPAAGKVCESLGLELVETTGSSPALPSAAEPLAGRKEPGKARAKAPTKRKRS